MVILAESVQGRKPLAVRGIFGKQTPIDVKREMKVAPTNERAEEKEGVGLTGVSALDQ